MFKKSAIGAIYALLLAVFITLFFIIFGPPPASCFDNIRNGQETGVDCGGTCRACIGDLQQPPLVRQVAFLPTVSGKVDLVAIIENPNASAGAAKVNYKFSLLDAGGRLIRAISNETRDEDIRFRDAIFLLPAATRPIIVPAVTVSAPVSRVNFEASVPADGWQTDSAILPPHLFIKPQPGIQYNLPTGAFANYKGLLTNDSSYELQAANIDVVVRNSAGEIVAVNRQEQTNLLPGRDQIVEFTWFAVNPLMVGLTNENFAFTVSTNIYVPGNVVLRERPPQPFQRPGLP